MTGDLRGDPGRFGNGVLSSVYPLNRTWMAGEPRFPLGRIAVTAKASAQLYPADVLSAFWRHAHGDWGDITENELQENETALLRSIQLMSVYQDRRARRFWIVTEADRSQTTVMLPEESYLHRLCYDQPKG